MNPNDSKQTPGRKRGVSARGFRASLLPEAHRRAFACAWIVCGNRSLAFQQIFGAEYAGLPKATMHYYARQLELDEVVRKEVAFVLKSAAAASPDNRAAAKEVVVGLDRVCRGQDHKAKLAADLIGKPVSALKALPPELSGMVEKVAAKDDGNGGQVISGVTLVSPVRAAEILSQWVAIANGEVRGKPPREKKSVAKMAAEVKSEKAAAAADAPAVKSAPVKIDKPPAKEEVEKTRAFATRQMIRGRGGFGAFGM